MKYFKVSCEYYIQAKDGEEAGDFVKDEIIEPFNFYESHMMIEETNKEIAEKEGIYNE